MDRYAKIHNAIQELTGNINKTSEQHREVGVATITGDVRDLLIIHSWFTGNYPFPTVIEPIKLVQKIQQCRDYQTYISAKVLGKEKIFTFATLHSALKIVGLVVRDLRSEAKGSQFESGCYLCAELNSLQ